MMKKTTFCILMLVFYCTSAQEKPVQLKKNNSGNYVPVIGDYLYMLKYEVSNFDYLSYLLNLQQNGKMEACTAALPDTLVWREKLSYNEPYVEYYFRHPAYRNYPLLGVSYEQAKTFCVWLTDELNKHLSSSDLPFKKIIARLPTEKEWELAARAGDDKAVYAWQGDDLTFPESAGKKKKFQARANFCNRNSGFGRYNGWMNDYADVTCPVEAYEPNAFGLYNMCGNVAEMVEEKGIAKGGGWSSLGGDIRVDSKMKYDAPSSKVGFRPVLEVLEWKEETKKVKLNAALIEEMMAYIPPGSFHCSKDETGEGYRIKTVSSFYIAKTEISNGLYNFFLSELKQKDSSLALLYRVQNENWKLESPLLNLQNYSDNARYSEYPLVNVTYAAAKAFCKWLTEKYASFPDAKFKGAVFSLPDETQWEYAARGGIDLRPYPWEGPYLRNKNGNYLANFNPLEDRYFIRDVNGNHVLAYPQGDSTVSRGLDKYTLCAPVKSYFPNDYGLYNMAGNVTEMTEPADTAAVKSAGSEKQKTQTFLLRGGSFASMGYYLQNGVKDELEMKRMKNLKAEALPTVGFRVVMKVEEKRN